MKLTIITRTYSGRHRYIARAAEFVFGQTYRPIEWLIVEDGPAETDTTISGLAIPEGVTVRILKNAKIGRSAAANAGLDEATGLFVCFFDDDDEIFPSHAEILISLLDEHPNAAGAYAASVKTTIIDGNPAEESVFFAPTVGSYALLWMNLFPIQAVIFRRDAVQSNRFDLNLDALEDWLFWLFIFLERKLVWTPEITSRFFVLGGEQGRQRLQGHADAIQYVNLQREALIRERGGADIDYLRSHHNAHLLRTYAATVTGVQEPGSANPNSPPELISGLQPGKTKYSKLKKNVAFTSITLGYLPKALVLAKSLKRFHPDWEFHILMNDALPEGLEQRLPGDVDVIIPAGAVGIENFHSWCFAHNLVELCCATKPFYFKKLLDAGYEHVFFIDPDIKLFSDLGSLLERLETHDVLITPHVDKPAKRDSEIFFTERSVLAHGLFNLGFLAARSSSRAFDVIEFWRSRLMRYCIDDHRRGLFNDQKWFNLVPLFFEGVDVVRHEGCNVASWNISHRPIREVGGRLYAGKDPLIFFHFSGYDANVPKTMFQMFGAYNETLAALLADYDAEVAENCKSCDEFIFPWAFRSFDNSVVITDAIRRFYRRSLEHRIVYPEPYFSAENNSFFAHVERIGISEINEKYEPHLFGD